jgi:hypothetical protein
MEAGAGDRGAREIRTVFGEIDGGGRRGATEMAGWRKRVWAKDEDDEEL